MDLKLPNCEIAAIVGDCGRLEVTGTVVESCGMGLNRVAHCHLDLERRNWLPGAARRTPI